MTDVAQPAEIDLRTFPAWERPDQVRKALDRLPTGSSLTLITENEPRALSSRISQERPDRFVMEARRIASRMWQFVDRATYCPIVYNWMEAVKELTKFKKPGTW